MDTVITFSAVTTSVVYANGGLNSANNAATNGDVLS